MGPDLRDLCCSRWMSPDGRSPYGRKRQGDTDLFGIFLWSNDSRVPKVFGFLQISFTVHLYGGKP